MGSEREEDASAVLQLILRLRRGGVKDNRILEAIERTDRTRFVNQNIANLCETDLSLPIPFGQTSLRPIDAGRILQLADIKDKTNSVLIAGGGTGYLAGIVEQIGCKVWVAERVKGLVDLMKSNLAETIQEYKIAHCDYLTGWTDDTQFDRIIVCFGVDWLSRRMLRNLRRGGRIVLPLKRGRSLVATAYDSNGKDVDSLQLIGPVTTGLSGISNLA